jgi:hypothetical protein
VVREEPIHVRRLLNICLTVLVTLAAPAPVLAQSYPPGIASENPAPGRLAFTRQGCGDAAIGTIAFTGLPQAGDAPSALLSFRMSTSRGPDGAVAAGPLWLCKPMDGNSAGLLLAALMGSPVASISLDVAQPNTATASVDIVLNNALVTSVSVVPVLTALVEELELLSCDVEITVTPVEGPARTFLQRCGPSGP